MPFFILQFKKPTHSYLILLEFFYFYKEHFPFIAFSAKISYSNIERQERVGKFTMKENLATFPLLDAFHAKDECPFCYLERAAEQHAVSFILGSAYMEDDIREKTDALGFCRHHSKMMYDYGNRLGNALILSTHLRKINRELAEELKKFIPGKSSPMARFKKNNAKDNLPKTELGRWLYEKEHTCYVCDHFKRIYARYLDTFFSLYKKDNEFRNLFLQSRGFCLPHFRNVVEAAENKLSDAEKNAFYPALFRLMQEHLSRLQKEVEWFVEKNDYRNKDKDWGTSADSIQRGMQKCTGGYPADPVFKARL